MHPCVSAHAWVVHESAYACAYLHSCTYTYIRTRTQHTHAHTQHTYATLQSPCQGSPCPSCQHVSCGRLHPFSPTYVQAWLRQGLL